VLLGSLGFYWSFFSVLYGIYCGFYAGFIRRLLGLIRDLLGVHYELFGAGTMSDRAYKELPRDLLEIY
jgi:hypothetical protein